MMGKYLVIMRYLISTICIVLLLSGCDRTVDTTAQPRMVRKKIVAQKEQTAKVGTNKTMHTAKTSDTTTQPGMVRKKVVVQKEQTAKVGTKKTIRTAKKGNPTAQPGVVRKKIVAQKELTAKVGTKKRIPAAETSDTRVQPGMVRKKVVAPMKPIAKSSLDTPVRTAKTNQVTRLEENKTAVKTGRIQANAKKPATPKTKTDRRTLVVKKVQVTPTTDTAMKLPALKKTAAKPKSDISLIQLTATADNALPSNNLIAATSNVTPKMSTTSIPEAYNATGKIDPFEPLFREKPVATKKKKGKKRIPQTPLERIDLSQLKLVGIILASSGNRALVEESSGKGYVIKTGTYIGVNSGKVVKIRKEKVVVEEEFEDVFGKIKLRQREIKLPKPPGEF